MKKILSLFAGLCLVLSMTINVSADPAGLTVSYEKKNSQLVATVTADGTLGAAVIEIEYDADELSCSADSVAILPSDDYVVYEYNVTEDAVCIGFVAIDPDHIPEGKIATIIFDIAPEVKDKAADEFAVNVNEEEVVTVEELEQIIAGEEDNENEGGNQGGNQGGNEGGNQGGNTSGGSTGGNAGGNEGGNAGDDTDDEGNDDADDNQGTGSDDDDDEENAGGSDNQGGSSDEDDKDDDADVDDDDAQTPAAEKNNTVVFIVIGAVVVVAAVAGVAFWYFKKK